MVREIMDYISSCDEAVGKALYAEYHRQQRNLELIASENIVSPAVMLAMGTVPTNKYAEGYPEKRYYGGCEEVDVLEDLAIERAKKLFGIMSMPMECWITKKSGALPWNINRR